MRNEIIIEKIKKARHSLRYLARQFAVTIIKFYQTFISPALGPHCRFYPSCSQFALDAIRLNGVIYGTMQAISRILRCNPLHPGGIDEVQRQGLENG